MVSLDKQLHAKSNGLRAAGAQAIGEMLKVNKTLTLLDLSDNEIGMWSEGSRARYNYKEHPTPEGPAALADGLKANKSVQQLDVSANGLGADGGKAIATSIAENRTITSVKYLSVSRMRFYLLF